MQPAPTIPTIAHPCALAGHFFGCAESHRRCQGLFVEVIPMKYERYVDDPVLVRADFYCGYCGRDLLGDLDTFLTIARDHLVPRSAGGPDGSHNRVASCAACDRLKADAVVDGIEAARVEIAGQRASRAVWLDRIRAMVRSGEPDGDIDFTEVDGDLELLNPAE